MGSISKTIKLFILMFCFLPKSHLLRWQAPHVFESHRRYVFDSHANSRTAALWSWSRHTQLNPLSGSSPLTAKGAQHVRSSATSQAQIRLTPHHGHVVPASCLWPCQRAKQVREKVSTWAGETVRHVAGRAGRLGWGLFLTETKARLYLSCKYSCQNEEWETRWSHQYGVRSEIMECSWEIWEIYFFLLVYKTRVSKEWFC